MFKSKQTWVLLAVLLAGFIPEKIFGFDFGYCEGGNPWGRLFYIFQHGGVLHLLCNWFSASAFVFALRRVYRVDSLVSYAVALFCAWFGTFGTECDDITVGASGAVFALVGFYSTFNVTKGWLVSLLAVALSNVVMLFVGRFNVALHFVCAIYGFVCGCVYHAWERVSVKHKYGNYE